MPLALRLFAVGWLAAWTVVLLFLAFLSVVQGMPGNYLSCLAGAVSQAALAVWLYRRWTR